MDDPSSTVNGDPGGRAAQLREEGLAPSEIAQRLNHEGVLRDGRPHTWMRSDVVQLLGVPLSRSLDDDEFVPASANPDAVRPTPRSTTANVPGRAGSAGARARHPLPGAVSVGLKVLGVAGLLVGLAQGGANGIFGGCFVLLMSWGVAVALDMLIDIDRRTRATAASSGRGGVE